MTAEEMRALFSRINSDLDELRMEVESLRNRLSDIPPRTLWDDPDDLRHLADEADNVGL